MNNQISQTKTHRSVRLSPVDVVALNGKVLSRPDHARCDHRPVQHRPFGYRIPQRDPLVDRGVGIVRRAAHYELGVDREDARELTPRDDSPIRDSPLWSVLSKTLASGSDINSFQTDGRRRTASARPGSSGGLGNHSRRSQLTGLRPARGDGGSIAGSGRHESLADEGATGDERVKLVEEPIVRQSRRVYERPHESPQVAMAREIVVDREGRRVLRDRHERSSRVLGM